MPANYKTLIQALLAAPHEKPFITLWHGEDDIEEVTFGQFVHLARLHAAQFHEHGLQAGDRTILILPQGISLMAAFAGAMLLGAVPAILAYPNFKADPGKYAAGLAGVTKNLRARLIVVDDEFSGALSGHIIMPPDAQLLRSVAASITSQPPAQSEFSSDANGVAFIQHSAGTTGLQKGVALWHVAVLTQLRHLADALEIREGDRIYS